MPIPAIIGTYPHPHIPGATMTGGAEHVVPWLNRHHARSGVTLAVDIETYGLGVNMRRIKCVVLATPDAVLLIDPREPYQAEQLRRALWYADAIQMWQATADVPSLCHNQLMDPRSIDRVDDGVIYARLADPGLLPSKRLEDTAHRLLGWPLNPVSKAAKAAGQTKADYFRINDIDRPAYFFGAAADGIATARLTPLVRQYALERFTHDHPFDGLSAYEAGLELAKQQRLNQIWLHRTVKGLRVDLEFLERYRETNRRQRAESESALRAVGVDPGNGNHLTAYLGRIGALAPDYPRTASGRPSATADDLATIAHPIARTFVGAKQLAKVEDDYLDKCAQLSLNGRIHPTVSVLAAAHGRSSMSDAPIHQFPAPARGIILADEGDGLGSTDWAQQEPVIGLNVAGDVDALHEYDHLGKKIYHTISAFSGAPYDKAKVVLLAGMYGEGPGKLTRDMGLDPGPYVPKIDRDTRLPVFDPNGDPIMVPTYAAAKALQKQVFSAIPKTWQLILNLKAMAKQHRKIMTVNGRILPIPMGRGFDGGPPGVQTHKGPNYFISGSASDQLTDTIIELDRMGLSDALYFGMHDELLHSVQIAHEVRTVMERPSERLIKLSRRVPVIRTDFKELGERWAKA